jgi:hypothetical protein
MSIRCGHCRNRHETITEVRACSGQGASTPASSAPRKPATEGMYVLDGTVYKVLRAVHGSGRLYAQRLTPDGFQAERGALNWLTQAHRMTAEEAAAYGNLYGRCVRCQAPLTDGESIKRGIGPICATKI